jgi:translocator protein
MKTFIGYQELNRLPWAPPEWVFSPVWAILYILIAISFGTIFYKAVSGELPFIVALPFVLNLIFNFAFVPIQFKLKNNYLATADILLVLGTLVWALIAIWHFGLTRHIETGAPTYAWIIYANIPHLLWVSFATILHISMNYLNRRKTHI